MYSQYLGFMYFGILLVLGVFRDSVLQILLILPSILGSDTAGTPGTRSIWAFSTAHAPSYSQYSGRQHSNTLSTRSTKCILGASVHRLKTWTSLLPGSGIMWLAFIAFHISQVLRLPASIIRVFSRKSTLGTSCTQYFGVQYSRYSEYWEYEQYLSSSTSSTRSIELQNT